MALHRKMGAIMEDVQYPAKDDRAALGNRLPASRPG